MLSRARGSLPARQGCWDSTPLSCQRGLDNRSPSTSQVGWGLRESRANFSFLVEPQHPAPLAFVPPLKLACRPAGGDCYDRTP